MKLPVIICALYGITCLAGEVKSYPTDGVDFSRVRTYHWFPVKILTKAGIIEDDPEVSPLVRTAVDRELKKKGFTQVADGMDVLIATLVLQKAEPQIEAIIFGPAVWPGSSWSTGPVSTVGRYNHMGSLFVNMIDPRVNKSVWVGMTTKALGKPANRASDIDKAASDLFKKYPGKSKKDPGKP